MLFTRSDTVMSPLGISSVWKSIIIKLDKLLLLYGGSHPTVCVPSRFRVSGFLAPPDLAKLYAVVHQIEFRCLENQISPHKLARKIGKLAAL